MTQAEIILLLKENLSGNVNEKINRAEAKAKVFHDKCHKLKKENEELKKENALFRKQAYKTFVDYAEGMVSRDIALAINEHHQSFVDSIAKEMFVKIKHTKNCLKTISND